jgi:Ca2+-binding RTX toxin-like protein
VTSGGHAQGDTLVSIDDLIGSNHADTLVGDDAVNVIHGGFGEDYIFGGPQKDVLDGGAGNDTLEGGDDPDTLHDTGVDSGDWVTYFNTVGVGVGVDLTTGLGTGGALGDQYSGIENIFGSPQADGLIGDDNDNYIRGWDGDDSLLGGDGDDRLEGEDGGDTLIGGRGDDTLDGGDDTAADRFILFPLPQIMGVETIRNFDPDADGDQLVISAALFGILSLTDGSNFFNVGSAPTNTLGTGPTLINHHDGFSGDLYYDIDGAGGTAPVIIASAADDAGGIGFAIGLVVTDFDIVA